MATLQRAGQRISGNGSGTNGEALGLIETKGPGRHDRGDRRHAQGGQCQLWPAGFKWAAASSRPWSRVMWEASARPSRPGAEAAGKVGELVGAHVIPRPDEVILKTFLG